MTRLMRYTPVTTLSDFQRQVDRLFDEFLPARRAEDGEEAQSAVWSPRVDLGETDEAYLIQADLPGLTREDLNINFHDNTLTISGERTAEETEQKTNFYRVERLYGHFYRSFNLPKTVQASKIDARFLNGVLTITVPKAEESKPISIKVK